MSIKLFFILFLTIPASGCGKKAPKDYIPDAKIALRNAIGPNINILSADSESVSGNVCGSFEANKVNEIYYYDGAKKLLSVGADAQINWKHSCGAWKRAEDLSTCKYLLSLEAKADIEKADWNIEKRIDECMQRFGHRL